MSNGEAPFQTKFTVGLLTIEPCPQNDPLVTEEEYELSPEELAAREAIAKRKAKKKKIGKTKSSSSRSCSPIQKRDDPAVDEAVQLAVKKRMEAKRREKEEAARREAEEEARLLEEARAKIDREYELKRQAEEEGRRKSEEARRQAEEEEARRKAEEEEEARRLAEEEEARRLAEEEEKKKPVLKPKVPERKLTRRISCFPITKDNTGLVEALARYDNYTPFDWEKEEWTREHVNLRHTDTITKTYEWEKPEWALRNPLRSGRTLQGKHIRWRKPEWASKSILKNHNFLDDLLMDDSSRYSIDDMDGSIARRRVALSASRSNIEWEKPIWAKRSMLKSTEAGQIIRQGIALELKNLKMDGHQGGVAGGSIGDDSQDSFVNFNQSLNMTNVFAHKSVDWEKPEWAKKKVLRDTEAGNAIKQGVSLAMPVVERNMGDSTDSLHKSLNMSKNITWEKPSWASNPGLKKTGKGDKLKESGSLERPVTFPKGKADETEVASSD